MSPARALFSPHSGATLFTLRLGQLPGWGDKAVLLALRVFYVLVAAQIAAEMVWALPAITGGALAVLSWVGALGMAAACLHGMLYFRPWGYWCVVTARTVYLLVVMGMAALMEPGGVRFDIDVGALLFVRYTLDWMAALGVGYIRAVTVSMPWYGLGQDESQGDVFGAPMRFMPSPSVSDGKNPLRRRPLMFAVLALIVFPALMFSALRSDLGLNPTAPADAHDMLPPLTLGSKSGVNTGAKAESSPAPYLYNPEGAILPKSYGISTPPMPVLPLFSSGAVDEALYLCGADMAEFGPQALAPSCKKMLRNAYNNGAAWVRVVYLQALKPLESTWWAELETRRFIREFPLGVSLLLAMFTVLYAVSSFAASVVQERVRLPLPGAGSLLALELVCLAGALAVLTDVALLAKNGFTQNGLYGLAALVVVNVVLACILARRLPASYALR